MVAVVALLVALAVVLVAMAVIGAFRYFLSGSALVKIYFALIVAAVVAAYSGTVHPQILLVMAFGIVSLNIVCIISYQLYAAIYFRGRKYSSIKESIQKYILDCNQLNDHVESLKQSYLNVRSVDYGEGHLYDTSDYKMKRKSWSEKAQNRWTHHCTAAVLKNASDQPFRYLCKYFDIKLDEHTLTSFEQVLNDFAAAEQGKLLVNKRREEIVGLISKSIPALILRFSRSRLIRELGFKNIDLGNLYFPVYTFQYVSAGGNSSSKLDIRFDLETLERFISYLSGLVKFRKSVAGQRALMTSALREKIKVRDRFSCQICSLSTAKEANLLLEIDHIIPLSKGGITSEENLQTLCWRCNRSKGAKYSISMNNSASV